MDKKYPYSGINRFIVNFFQILKKKGLNIV